MIQETSVINIDFQQINKITFHFNRKGPSITTSSTTPSQISQDILKNIEPNLPNKAIKNLVTASPRLTPRKRIKSPPTPEDIALRRFIEGMVEAELPNLIREAEERVALRKRYNADPEKNFTPPRENTEHPSKRLCTKDIRSSEPEEKLVKDRDSIIPIHANEEKKNTIETVKVLASKKGISPQIIIPTMNNTQNTSGLVTSRKSEGCIMRTLNLSGISPAVIHHMAKQQCKNDLRIGRFVQLSYAPSCPNAVKYDKVYKYYQEAALEKLPREHFYLLSIFQRLIEFQSSFKLHGQALSFELSQLSQERLDALKKDLNITSPDSSFPNGNDLTNWKIGCKVANSIMLVNLRACLYKIWKDAELVENKILTSPVVKIDLIRGYEVWDLTDSP
jgi:hypothetical protein